MGSKKLLTTLLASGLAEAVHQDEKPEAGGFDLSAGMFGPAVSEWLRSTAEVIDTAQTGAKPIDMVLHCPRCHKQHIDAPEGGPEMQPDGSVHTEEYWSNPPHRSHQCHHCRFVWRPADVPTNGVLATKTRGKNDMVVFGPEAPIETPELPKLEWPSEGEAA